jgi:iron(III) transport system substrate-binding protein
VTPLGDDVVAAGEKEGSVLVYGNVNPESAAPIVKGFKAAHPKIKLKFLDLTDAQIFQRYQTESATGTSTADILMTADQAGMQKFAADGNISDFEDPNVPNLPDFANLAPGIVAASTDPLIAVFNKSVLPPEKQPKSLSEFADRADELKGKIGTTGVENSVIVAAINSYIDREGEKGWETLEKIGPGTGVESGTGNLAQKLLQGEYVASFNVSGTLRALIVGDAAKVLNYTYLTDGTPLIPRAMAITAKAPHPNAAKVFQNYLLSVEGQTEACKGGFTPYRAGVECPFGLAAVEEAVGKDNVIVDTWDPELGAKKADLVKRWNEAFGR